MTKDRKAVWGWALYDWANSAFATTVMAGFFPVFFKQYWSHGADVNLSTAQLGFGNSIAGLVMALLAPVLGAMADIASAKKRFLIFFAYLGALSTAALYLIGQGRWASAILCYALGVIGFSGANVFYDALLPSVAPPERVDTVSSLGYALGYLGGGLLFLLNVAMTLTPHTFGLPDASSAVRTSFVSVAVWWGGFTVFTIAWVPEQTARPAALGGRNTLSEGFKQVAATFRKIRRYRPVLIFLLAYWCYIDGVDTIIRMAVDYGLSLGFASTDLIAALLVVQFVGFPAALVFGRLGRAWGARRAIFLGIGIYMGVTVWGATMTNRLEFYVMAVLIGLVQGGIQALSRSYYSRLIPADQPAEFFGFYNMLGKFASIVGPALMGGVGLAVRRALMPAAPTAEELARIGHMASRWSIASILILFIVGAVLLYFVEDPQKGRPPDVPAGA
ncbi:MAG: MFS transporter [Desulfobacterales bacterium]|nr:MFS transporter [Desulfobacterales bacterium]